jgi:hypothetical protein
MSKLYADRKLLIVDSGGMNVHEAERLARDWGKVYYFCPNYAYNPDLKKSMMGERLKDVKVIEQWMWKWNEYGKTDGDYVFNEITDFYFPDVYMGDIQMHLIHDCGKNVWGSRKAEELELLRFETKEKLAAIGLAVTPTYKFKNYNELVEYLAKEDKPKFLKLSWFRGVIESAKFESISKSVSTFAELKKSLEDACAEEGDNAMELLVEELIESDIEYGIDTHTVDGKIPSEVSFGLEIKDKLYLCTHKPLTELPQQIQDTTFGLCKLIGEYGENGCRSKIATEVRLDKKEVDEDGNAVGHLMDITMRNPSPNTEIQQEWIKNYSEIIKEGSEGKLIEPIYETKYAAQVEIYCLKADKSRVDIKIPDEIKQWVKLRTYCGKGKTGSQEYSVIPTGGLIEICNVVGLDDTIDGCFDKIRSYAEKIEGKNLEFQWDAIDDVKKELKKMAEAGINF